MHEPDNSLTVGTRIRLTPLGVERCPRLKAHDGVVVGVGRNAQSFRVLISGRTDAITLHASYIERAVD